MHRFLIEPKALGYKSTVFNHWGDLRWQALVQEFRTHIRYREWKDIDRRLRLFVKVENWHGQDVLLIANPPHDSFLIDAYVKAGFLEGQHIMAFADDTIPWERLKPFKAVNPRRGTRSKDGATRHNEGTASESLPARATEERHTRPSSLVNGTGRSGDPDTVAGDCLIRPKQHEADCRGKDPSSQSPTLTVRLAPGPGSTECSA